MAVEADGGGSSPPDCTMKMTIQDYLKAVCLSFPVYRLADEDERIISGAGMGNYIFRKLTSRQFRSSSLTPEIGKRMEESIKARVRENRPIAFSVPTGGNKKRQWKEAPFVDWSEVFNVVFMAQYVAAVLAVYKPGVEMEYVSNEIDMELLGNYSRGELKAYTDSFQEMLRFLKKYLPRNLSISFREMRDEFAVGEYEECLKAAKPDLDELYREFEKKPIEGQEKQIEKARRNYKFSPQENGLPEKEKTDILIRTALIHDMYVKPIWLGFMAKKNYLRNDNKMPVAFYHCGWGIHLKSSPGSTAQFWVGKGVVVEEQDGYRQSILTTEQYKGVKDRCAEAEVSIFPESLVNLRQVTVVRKK